MLNKQYVLCWWWRAPWKKVNKGRGWRCWEWGWRLMGHGAGAWTSRPEEWAVQSAAWGRPRQKEQQAQVWCHRAPGVFAGGSSVSERKEEEMKPPRITLQTKWCCKITFCCLDIIKVKIGIKSYYKNGSNSWLKWTCVEGNHYSPCSKWTSRNPGGWGHLGRRGY